MEFRSQQLPAQYAVLAPDGSEVRLLGRLEGGSLVHCTLSPGKVTRAVKHRSVEEIWYCLEGQGEIWRQQPGQEEITRLETGTSLTIPTGTSFQFRNSGSRPLQIVIITMPPWPGNAEAVPVEGPWKAEI
jgi:mannose-6-phosphate isomerase-like protein (cupin superfamily)